MYLVDVAEGTYRLETRIPGLPTVFSIYFIRGKTDTLILEPGPAVLVPTIEAGVRGLSPGNVSYIIPTHLHLDHAGAIGRLAQVFPRATVVVNAEGARHVVDPSRLIRSTKMAFGDDFETVYGSILPVPESRIKIAQDNETLSVNNRGLTIIYTPGHAPHHMAIFDASTGGLFCGEALGLVYVPGSPPLPAVSPPSFDLNAYLDDMERLRKLRPRLLFYSHGGVGSEPDRLIASAIDNTREIGEVMLSALKAKSSEEAVIRTIGDYIERRFGVRLDEYDLASNVMGYIHYFEKKGIYPPQ